VIHAAKSGDYWDYFAGGASPWITMGAVTRDTFVDITSLEYAYGVRAVNVLSQRGFYSDFVPCADRGLVNLGWFRGDGRFAPAAPDTFWNDIGQGEIRVEQGRSVVFDDRVEIRASPNPFNPEIKIDIRAGKDAGDITAEIYDISGKCVARPPVPGRIAVWKAVDGAGRSMASGLYVVRVRTGGGKQAFAKIVLQR
jgi:hypothetical protein